MRTYTREEIEIGFRNWNKYVANGGDVIEYEAKTADEKNQTDTLIDFMELTLQAPAFPADRTTKHQEG